MKIINLRDYYPHYEGDSFEVVPDRVAEIIQEFERREKSYQRRLYRYKAYFSLDAGDGIEHEALYPPLTPEDAYMRKVEVLMLHSALASLSEKQRRRIYAHYFLDMSRAAIARTEGVSEIVVRQSIVRGLRNIKKFFEKL
jgi:RNA polymerase sigma-70 factor (ECF subfamily)